MVSYKKNIFKRVYTFFDKVEDKVRAHLSRSPIFYAFIGAFSILILWKGIWETLDRFLPWLTGPYLILISIVILLLTGLFVSSFIGDAVIISGLKKEKKITEREIEEIEKESQTLEHIEEQLKNIEAELHIQNEQKLDK
ncbi:MAG: hypothetical protein WC795_03075 [Candidatus Paceibacterota bacterium]|jgi:uncharacterized protein YneF (UPF0154 family)